MNKTVNVTELYALFDELVKSGLAPCVEDIDFAELLNLQLKSDALVTVNVMQHKDNNPADACVLFTIQNKDLVNLEKFHQQELPAGYFVFARDSKKTMFRRQDIDRVDYFKKTAQKLKLV